MLAFYKKVLAYCFALSFASLLVMYAALENSVLRDPLLPKSDSAYAWQAFANSDAGMGGSSAITLNSSEWEFDFDFLLKSDVQHPFASLVLEFDRGDDPLHFTDFSQYSTLAFEVRCRPRNVMQLSLQTFDENITRLDEVLSFRIPAAFFSCDEKPRHMEIDLHTLEVPEWWLQYNKLELSDGQYDLRKVRNIGFTATSQSPMNTAADVVIEHLELRGRQWHSVYIGGILCLLMWIGFVVWFFRQYKVALTGDIQEKMIKDRPLIAYQQLSIEPQNDREKNSVLRFMATEYSNSELSVEVAVNSLGISRNKINDILKEQLGMTFNVYLNKLRLTEAARLLTENKEANITEIVYSVGYNNVSYFNKLFKTEYGCTPKTFKNLSQSDKTA
jgi:AraC-like DNA-binding protein